MFGLENRGETLIFMSRHFDETMTILISHFLRFGALKMLTGDYFVLRINQIMYSKQKKMDVLFILVFFPALFLRQFSHSLCTGWRRSGVWNDISASK